jgi:selT/selW/selH-like putative selenoprotein
LKQALEREFKDQVQVTMEVGRTSSFEVTIDGNEVYSKLKSGGFPTSQTIIDAVKAAK